MSYKITLLREAQTDLLGLPKTDAKQIALKIKNFLEINPFPHGKNPKRLSAKAKRYRLRIGNYRAVYRIENMEVIVEIIGDRKNVYNRL